MPLILVLDILIEDKVRTVFIDSVVSKMHTFYIQIIGIRLLVCFCGKSSQSLFMEVYSQRVATSYQNIEPKVELKTIYQKRLFYIPLNDARLCIFELL